MNAPSEPINQACKLRILFTWTCSEDVVFNKPNSIVEVFAYLSGLLCGGVYASTTEVLALGLIDARFQSVVESDVHQLT